MGNTSSRSSDNNVFQKELTLLNSIVNNILSEKDVFKNNDYNFLSQDVCNKYQVVLEEELQKHLKLSIKTLGTSLYIIPKDDETKLTRLNLTKQQVCEKISNHYIKILYIMSLIKYVYNIEKNGDMSIAGIAFRNIRILDDIMEINFCDIPHKNYNFKDAQALKINFGKLEGFKFFVDYFLEKEEASAFLGVVRSILARANKQKVAQTICYHIAQKHFKVEDIKELERLYTSRFGSKYVCKTTPPLSAQDKEPAPPTSASKRNISIDIFINKDNPIFAKEFCYAPRKVVIKTSTAEGKQVFELYKVFKKNYEANISKIITIIQKLVIPNKDGSYTLKDIDKSVLDGIIEEVKVCIKTFYVQSIIDYQNLLDKAKLIPNIQFS
jgi:hypothetical protein